MKIHGAFSVFLNIVKKIVRLSSSASLAGVKWYLLETLICISLLAKETEHLFIYSLGIPHFLYWEIFFFLLGCLYLSYRFTEVLFTYSRYCLSVICTRNILSRLLDCHSLIPFNKQKSYIIM